MGVQGHLPVSQSCKDIAEDVPRSPRPPSPLPQETALLPRLPLMSAPLFMTLCALQKEGSRDRDQTPV